MLTDIIIGDGKDFRRQILPLPPAPELGSGLQLVWDYWNLTRGDRFAPTRRDIDPLDIPEALTGIILYDVECAPMRFRYRLAGTDTDKIHGEALKGRHVDTLQPIEFAEMLHNDFVVMTEQREPQLAQLNFWNAEGNHRAYEALRLPLAGTNGEVAMIMVFANHGHRKTG